MQKFYVVADVENGKVKGITWPLMTKTESGKRLAILPSIENGLGKLPYTSPTSERRNESKGELGLMRPIFEERLWSKIDIRGPDECWPWLGVCGRKGHGRVSRDGKLVQAHVEVYWLTHSCYVAPDEIIIRHTCDNPPCCNPKHLLAGTHQDNVDDMRPRGRSVYVRGSRNGLAKLTENQALAIRQDHRLLRVIAAEYGVSMTTVSDVKRKRSWKHV